MGGQTEQSSSANSTLQRGQATAGRVIGDEAAEEKNEDMKPDVQNLAKFHKLGA